MPRRYSQIFNITHRELTQKGVLNACVDVDSKLHIDPSLLKNCKIPEFKGAYRRFISHFDDILRLVPYVKGRTNNDRFFCQIVKRLTFKEISNTGLGYSNSGTAGNGIGGKLSIQLANSAMDIIQAGIEDPVIFELMPFFEENIGPDRISDMTITLLHQNFIDYTQRIAKELAIKTTIVTKQRDGQKFELPCYKNKPVIFIPISLLCDLPIAHSWEDIDWVCSYNDALRLRISKLIGITWKEISILKKKEIKNLLLDNTTVFKDIVSYFKNKQSIPYDYENDKLGEFLCIEATENIAKDLPLNLKTYFPITPDNIFSVVEEICLKYKELIESNGLYELLYDNKNKCKPERAAQFLLYAVADAYCSANELDLSREVNSGVGSLDFKISSGCNMKVCVEVKYSSNDIIKGYNYQLPAYNRAEKTNKSILLVIRNTQNDNSKLSKLMDIQKKTLSENPHAPKVIIVDARIQTSASKRRK